MAKAEDKDTQVIEITLRQAIRDIIPGHIETKTSFGLLGTPGNGKDAGIHVAAQAKDHNALVFDGTSLDPTDIRGLMNFEGQRSFFTKSPLMPIEDIHGERGVLVFSDLSASLPSVKVALASLFHNGDRRLGSDRIPEGWIPCFTGNYSTDGSGASAIPEMFKDRCALYHVSLPLQDWREDYAIKKKIHPDILGFLALRPDLFNTFMKRAKSSPGKSFASARSYTYCSEMLYYADKNSMSSGSLLAIMAGYLSQGVAAELSAFRKQRENMPDLMQIFKGKDTIPKEPSMVYAVCSYLVAMIDEVGKQMGTDKAIDRILEYSTKLDAEFSALVVRDTYSGHASELKKSKMFRKVAHILMSND